MQAHQSCTCVLTNRMTGKQTFSLQYFAEYFENIKQQSSAETFQDKPHHPSVSPEASA